MTTAALSPGPRQLGARAPWRSRRPSPGSRCRTLLTGLPSQVRMQHGPLLGCHVRVAERQDRPSHLLTELMALAENRDHVARRRELQRQANRGAPVAAVDHLGREAVPSARPPARP